MVIFRLRPVSLAAVASLMLWSLASAPLASAEATVCYYNSPHDTYACFPKSKKIAYVGVSAVKTFSSPEECKQKCNPDIFRAKAEPKNPATTHTAPIMPWWAAMALAPLGLYVATRLRLLSTFQG